MTRLPEPRLAPLPRAQWAGEEEALLRGNLPRADQYLSEDPDAPPIPAILGLLARHPHLGGPWLAFNGALIDGGLLKERDRELLILRVGYHSGSRYLLSQHRSMGEAAGLERDEIESLLHDTDIHKWGERDHHLIVAVDELLDENVVSDATWLGLSDSFDERQMLEILFVVGSYACLGMVLNSVGLEPATKEENE